MPPDSARAAVERDFARLWASLQAIDARRDRQVMLDAVRASLDRGGGRLCEDADVLAGTYATEAIVAEGATSVVVKARHRDLGHVRAVKALRPDRANDPVFRRLMLREARHNMRLRHAAVVSFETLLRLGDGRPALVLDFIDGPTLAGRLSESALSLDECLILARRLSAGLAAVHEAGLVHLDLSPRNVMLPGGDPGRATIIDFGLSLEIGARRSDDDAAFAATPGVGAPELGDPDRTADPRADVFALGALLDRASGGASELVPLTSRLAAIDPDDRPATARAADDLIARFGATDAGTRSELRARLST